MEQPKSNDAAERASGSLERVVSRLREITPEDVTKEADRNYDLGRKHGHEEKAELLDWAETLLCNSLPMSHCSQEELDRIIKAWRDEKHGVAKSANSRSEAIEQQEKLDRERFEGLRFERYEEEPCPNCSRVRVGKRNNGKRICEKCCWDVDANAYNSDALGLM